MAFVLSTIYSFSFIRSVFCLIFEETMDAMNFSLKAGADYIEVAILRVYGYPGDTSHYGGYDAEMLVQIKSGGFSANAKIWASTGELYQLYQDLKSANIELKGRVHYASSEGNLTLNIHYDELGHVIVKGSFSENGFLDNILTFEFHTDQTFITKTLAELGAIVKVYGDMNGVIKD